LMIDYCSR